MSDKSAIQSFLEGSDESAQNFFELPQDDNNPFASTEGTVEETSDTTPVPFHKDPKLEKYLQKREREIRRAVQEDLQSTFSTAPTSRTETEDSFKDVIDSFTNIIGNDTPEKISALNALQRSLQNLDERSLQRAEEKIEEIRQAEYQQNEADYQHVVDGMEHIEETFNVDLTSDRARKTREEFLDFVGKIAPKDRDGDIIEYPDMTSAWETYSEIKRASTSPSRAKELASRSMSRSSQNSPNPQQKAMTWDTVNEYIDSLK